MLNKLLKNALYSLPSRIQKFFLYYIYIPLDFFDLKEKATDPPKSLLRYGGYASI